MKRILAMMLVLLVGMDLAQAQKFTVSGYVTDSSSGEPLIGVAVIDTETSLGTVTGNTGFYSLTLPKGTVSLLFSSLGYSEKTIVCSLDSNIKLDMTIDILTEEITAASVMAHARVSGARSSQMSAIEVPISQIKTIPAIAGEVDVIKALQLLPGVQSGTEGSAGLYVRGGAADENLLLMDGVPLYNVNHLFGFFSVFNADALKNVTLYKGNFPARFGGHLSSVVDVRTNDGNDREYHGSASIGLISSKINLEGPIVKGRTTFNISARRTYLDLLAKPALAIANKKGYDDANNYEKYGGGYNFYDLNAKISHRFKGGDRLSISYYLGDDKVRVLWNDSSTRPLTQVNPSTGVLSPTGKESLQQSSSLFRWRWGNMLSAVKWNHVLAPKLYMTAGVNYTRYRNNLGVGFTSLSAILSDEGRKNLENSSTDVKYNSLIDDVSATVDFDWTPEARHDVKFGTAYTYHTFNPGIMSMKRDLMDSENPDNNEDVGRTYGDKPIYTHEAAAYAEDNWSVTPWLKLNLGARASLYQVSGKTFMSIEPRLGARALLSDKFSVKASYSEMSQYIHLLCNSNLSMPSDLWVPVTNNIKPMRSRQTAAGFFYDRGTFEYSIEAYYKTMDNVLEYKDGASYLGSASGWEELVCMGQGWSYGAEFMVQKKLGKTTGWIGYTLAKAMRKFDKPGMVLNDGIPFPAKYDRRHDLSATITHKFSERFDLAGNFVLSSGNCGSLGLDSIKAPDLNEGDFSYSVDYLPHRNNYRMPLYNRMDIGMNFYRPSKRHKGMSIWNISIYNVYNRLNPFLVNVSFKSKESESPDGPDMIQPVLSQLSIFPILPSVSYTFKF